MGVAFQNSAAMVVFSSLRTILKPGTIKPLAQNQVRNGGHYNVHIRPSRWVLDKFKDDLHWYFMLAALPIGIAVTAVNVLVGPATLAPIPDGYHPTEEEYHRHPISRFIMKHFKHGIQENFEVHLHGMWELGKISEMRQLKAEGKRQMAIHGDYKGWYHRQDIAHYSRVKRESNENSMRGGGHKFVDWELWRDVQPMLS